MRKAQYKALNFLILLCLPFFILEQFAEKTGAAPLIISAVVVIGLIIFCTHASAKKRRALLLEKYGDPQLVEKIINRSFWQGQSAEQLLDALGNPADVDKQVLKTKSKEVWKYHPRGKNRYGLRITLENNSVIGWDQKN